jgi:hypothetical protein
MTKSLAFGAAVAATWTLFAAISPASAHPPVNYSSGRHYLPPAVRVYTPPPPRRNPESTIEVKTYGKINAVRVQDRK